MSGAEECEKWPYCNHTAAFLRALEASESKAKELEARLAEAKDKTIPRLQDERTRWKNAFGVELDDRKRAESQLSRAREALTNEEVKAALLCPRGHQCCPEVLSAAVEAALSALSSPSVAEPDYSVDPGACEGCGSENACQGECMDRPKVCRRCQKPQSGPHTCNPASAEKPKDTICTRNNRPCQPNELDPRFCHYCWKPMERGA